MPEHSWHVDISEHLNEGKGTDSLLNQAQPFLLGYRLNGSAEGHAQKDMISLMKAMLLIVNHSFRFFAVFFLLQGAKPRICQLEYLS